MTIEETKAYFSGFPEAPASDTFKWVDSAGFEHLLTLRAWHVKPLMNAIEEAQVVIAEIGGKPISTQSKVSPAPPVVQAKDELGTPVVDQEGKPVMEQVNMLPGEVICAIKGFYHGQTKNGEDKLKVVLADKPYSGKYGHYVFKPPFTDWQSWPLGGDPPALFTKPEYGHAIVRPPEEGGKYPEIVGFTK